MVLPNAIGRADGAICEVGMTSCGKVVGMGRHSAELNASLVVSRR